MTRKLLIVAALLFSNLAGIAAAAEETEHKPNNARKLIATLDSVGINSKEVKDFIAKANSHVDDKYVYFADQPVLNGTGNLSLRYNITSTVNNPNLPNTGGRSRRMELHYAPQNSKFEVVAGAKRLLLNYHLELK